MKKRIIFSVLFLALPVIGLLFVVDGFHRGPNYFGERIITIEELTYDTIKVISRRGPDEHFERRWTLGYSYVDGNNQKRFCQKKLRNGEFLDSPENYRVGDTLVHRICVDKTEGQFGLNQTVRDGLGILLYGSLLGFPILVVILFGHKPIVAKWTTWIVMIPLIATLLAILWPIIF